jgi:hypothetical protein
MQVLRHPVIIIIYTWAPPAFPDTRAGPSPAPPPPLKYPPRHSPSEPHRQPGPPDAVPRVLTRAILCSPHTPHNFRQQCREGAGVPSATPPRRVKGVAWHKFFKFSIDYTTLTI